MIEVMRTEVIDKLFMHEYFHINVAETVKKLEAFMKDPVNIDPYSPVNKAMRTIVKDNLSFQVSEIDLLLRNMQGHGTARYGVTLDIDFAANLIID